VQIPVRRARIIFCLHALTYHDPCPDLNLVVTLNERKRALGHDRLDRWRCELVDELIITVSTV
ncbi:hypothetical protein Q8G81_31265, partial [Klebsiella pneumoniae]